MKTIHVINPAIYRIIREEQGLPAILVKCVSNNYTSVEKRICRDRCYPPLICRNKPALLYPGKNGAMPQYVVKRPPMYIAPWGELMPFAVPIARYGLLRTWCMVNVDDNSVMLICYGEPDRRILKRILQVAERLSVTVAVASTRMYTWDNIVDIAHEIARGRRFLVCERGIPHVIVAAARYAVEELGVSISDVRRQITVNYDPSLSSTTRNLVKKAVDYMCSNGDDIACYASKYFHSKMWLALTGAG